MPVKVMAIPIARPLFSEKYEFIAIKKDDMAIPIPNAEKNVIYNLILFSIINLIKDI